MVDNSIPKKHKIVIRGSEDNFDSGIVGVTSNGVTVLSKQESNNSQQVSHS